MKNIIQSSKLSISMHIQNLIEIHKLIHKILSINKILMSIKSHNSVILPKIMCIRYNMDLVYIYTYTKFYRNSSICSKDIEEIEIHPFVLKILRKNTFLHQSRAITLLFINEFSPFAISNHSFLISMSMQSLKKMGQTLLKLESRNEALTDRWTRKRFGGYNIIPRYFLCDRV